MICLPWKRPFSMKISLCVVAADDYASEIQAGDVALQGLRIERGLVGGGVEFTPRWRRKVKSG